MSCNLYQKLCPKGLKNNPNKDLKAISYITIHNTGNYNATATAKSHANLQYKGDNGASWHYSVDKDEIWQSFLDNQMCWHAGDGNGKGNAESIGIEICVNDKAGFVNACDNAASLVADLLKRHNLPIARVVQHNKWTGKNCPEKIRSEDWGVSWGSFINKIEYYLKGDEPMLQPIKLNIDGQEMTVQGIIHNDKSYVPIREIATNTGHMVDFKDDTVIINTIMNVIKMLVDGEAFTIEGVNIGGHNYGGVAELLGRMGYDVIWEDDTIKATPRKLV